MATRSPPPVGWPKGGIVRVATVSRSNRGKWIRIAQIVGSAAVVVVIFALVLPKIASYSDVWKTISSLTWLEISTLVLPPFNLFTYWWQMMSALPGLSLGQAAVNNQSSTTIANILPGGGAIAVGVGGGDVPPTGGSAPRRSPSRSRSTTGIWNSFLKLGLPIVALVILTFTGHATTALLIPALCSHLVGCVTAFAMAL